TVTVALDEKSAPPPPQPTFTIGNIFLSSCPGKKVRLQGPVKGRSGVCRDLHADMRRMKDLGVGCIICCLDDAELEFLGAPWHLYERAAKAVGISVLRIPTPEGLAPPSPASLDAHLTRIIDTYTLRGVPILVHCRGGVGRAGVVACCWMLKLGLCGWPRDDAPKAPLLAGGVRLDTVELVERVIGIARRRRSIKAVETYEQVQFLVDFVEYLR
ncbi:protein-tyrosine phosphatase-like protein, partial [Mycena capillaripes]